MPSTRTQEACYCISCSEPSNGAPDKKVEFIGAVWVRTRDAPVVNLEVRTSSVAAGEASPLHDLLEEVALEDIVSTTCVSGEAHQKVSRSWGVEKWMRLEDNPRSADTAGTKLLPRGSVLVNDRALFVLDQCKGVLHSRASRLSSDRQSRESRKSSRIRRSWYLLDGEMIDDQDKDRCSKVGSS